MKFIELSDKIIVSCPNCFKKRIIETIFRCDITSGMFGYYECLDCYHRFNDWEDEEYDRYRCFASNPIIKNVNPDYYYK